MYCLYLRILMYQYICAMFCFENSINMERNDNSLLRSFIIYLNLIIVMLS